MYVAHLELVGGDYSSEVGKGLNVVQAALAVMLSSTEDEQPSTGKSHGKDATAKSGLDEENTCLNRLPVR